MRSLRVLPNSDINIINSLKLPLLLEASSSKGPSSRWPLKAIPWRPQYSIARSIEAMYCLFRLTTAADVCVINYSMRVVGFLKHDKKLFIFSMESLWYSTIEWFFKSSLVSFQLRYGCVMRILALDPWCADVGNKTHARQNNPSVDFEYDKSLKLSNNSCKQYHLPSSGFFDYLFIF